MIRVGTANAPERTDDTKRGLFAPAKRARRLLSWAHHGGVDLLGLQESGSILMTVLMTAVGRRWWATFASPNSIIRGHRIGNGLLGRTRTVSRPLARGRIAAPIAGRRRPLSLPERLVRVKDGGQRLVVIVVHKPRNQAQYADTRRIIDRAIAERVQQLLAAGLPVLVLGDFNGKPPAVPGLELLARHKADAILGAGVRRLGLPEEHALDGVSDHDALTVDVELLTSNTTARRLPKE